LCADDSGRTSVKVGHRQAFIPKTPLEQSSGVLPLRDVNAAVTGSPAEVQRQLAARSIRSRSLRPIHDATAI
ncbi:hypothetical protein, partial [Schauerella aestuarii]|uniref:hypothetical protein n=1 Tax=Schauerella aestuarii TaxID=2511204 RepID=UPI001F1CDF51